MHPRQMFECYQAVKLYALHHRNQVMLVHRLAVQQPFCGNSQPRFSIQLHRQLHQLVIYPNVLLSTEFLFYKLNPKKTLLTFCCCCCIRCIFELKSIGTVLTAGNTTTTTIGGKQILLQKPISLSGQNVLQLVKTSQGMAVQSMPKVNVMQKAGTSTINAANIQQQIMGGAQIVTAGGAGNQGAKTALIGTNVVKLVSPTSVGGNKIQIVSGAQIVKTGSAANQVQGLFLHSFDKKKRKTPNNISRTI